MLPRGKHNIKNIVVKTTMGKPEKVQWEKKNM
jgi:ribosomal protein L1